MFWQCLYHTPPYPNFWIVWDLCHQSNNQCKASKRDVPGTHQWYVTNTSSLWPRSRVRIQDKLKKGKMRNNHMQLMIAPQRHCHKHCRLQMDIWARNTQYTVCYTTLPWPTQTKWNKHNNPEYGRRWNRRRWKTISKMKISKQPTNSMWHLGYQWSEPWSSASWQSGIHLELRMYMYRTIIFSIWSLT